MTKKRSKILELHALGLTPLEIVEETGISSTTVYETLRLNGLERNKRSVSTDNAYIVERMKDPTQEVKLLAQELGCSPAKIYRAIKMAGVPAPMMNAQAMIIKAKALELAAEMYSKTAMTIADICRETGVRQPLLSEYIRMNGITPRQHTLRMKREGAVE